MLRGCVQSRILWILLFSGSPLDLSGRFSQLVGIIGIKIWLQQAPCLLRLVLNKVGDKVDAVGLMLSLDGSVLTLLSMFPRL
jgi:hypothetical protein